MGWTFVGETGVCGDSDPSSEGGDCPSDGAETEAIGRDKAIVS